MVFLILLFQFEKDLLHHKEALLVLDHAFHHVLLLKHLEKFLDVFLNRSNLVDYNVCAFHTLFNHVGRVLLDGELLEVLLDLLHDRLAELLLVPVLYKS